MSNVKSSSISGDLAWLSLGIHDDVKGSSGYSELCISEGKVSDTVAEPLIKGCFDESTEVVEAYTTD
jgi:hypothetical protein